MAAQATLPTAEVYYPAGAKLYDTHSTPQFKLGTRAKASDGQNWIYCKSSGAHALGALVAIDEDFVSRSATTSNATGANAPGWPQVAVATQSYYWAAIAGRNLYGKQRDGVAANAQLFTSTSVGIMTDAGSAGNPLAIFGAFAVGLSSGVGAAYEIMVLDGAKFIPKGIKVV
jgi:hypothetical protein